MLNKRLASRKNRAERNPFEAASLANLLASAVAWDGDGHQS